MAGRLPLPSHSIDQGNDHDFNAHDQKNGVLFNAQFDDMIVDSTLDPALFMDGDAESDYLGGPAEFHAVLDQMFGQYPDQTLMQPQMPTAPAAGYMPAPPAMPQNIMPNISMGPSWNPYIGWYYPVVPPAAMPPPPPMPFQMARTGFTPMATPAAALPPRAASRAAPQAAPPAPAATKGKAGRKRKYGPAAYLEKQATNPTPDARNVSITEADYTSKAKQRDERGKPKPRRAGATRKRKRLSIIQACICPDKSMVTRPKNAFILYRSAKAPEIFKALDKKDNQSVSKVAGLWWAEESEQVKDEYRQKAAEETARHKAMYPGYRYAPGMAQNNKFGFPNCVCGAYKANMDHMMAGLNLAPTGNGYYAAAESQEDDLHDMQASPLGDVQLSQPQAQMVAGRGHSNAAALGLRISTQQAGFQTSPLGLKRKRDATGDEAESSISRRLRSNRITGLNYATPDETDLFEPAAYADSIFAPAQPPAKMQRRQKPARIDTVAAQAELMDISITQPPQDVLPIDDSPVRDTRSKSRASLELERMCAAASTASEAADRSAPGEFDLPLDFNLELDIDWDQWGAMPLRGDDGDVVVASRRSSSDRSRSRRSSKKALGKSSSPKDRYSLRSKSRSQR